MSGQVKAQLSTFCRRDRDVFNRRNVGLGLTKARQHDQAMAMSKLVGNLRQIDGQRQIQSSLTERLSKLKRHRRTERAIAIKLKIGSFAHSEQRHRVFGGFARVNGQTRAGSSHFGAGRALHRRSDQRCATPG